MTNFHILLNFGKIILQSPTNDLKFCSNLYMHGVSMLEFLCRFTFSPNTVQVTRQAGNLYLESNYDAGGYLDFHPFSNSCLPSGNFTGAGLASLSVRNLSWNIIMTFDFDLNADEVTIRNFTIFEISFDRIFLDLGQNFRINGSPVDWEAFNVNFHSCFHTQVDLYRREIETKLMTALNQGYARFSLVDIYLFLFSGDCPHCWIGWGLFEVYYSNKENTNMHIM